MKFTENSDEKPQKLFLLKLYAIILSNKSERLLLFCEKMCVLK